MKLYIFFPHLGATSNTENDPENITNTDDEIEEQVEKLKLNRKSVGHRKALETALAMIHSAAAAADESENEDVEIEKEAEKQNSEIKASKDIKRLTEERNAAMLEYSLIMSERDSVHKEIEKLQEEIKEKNKKLASHEERNKHYDDEKRKWSCKIEMLKRELEQSMHERDKAMRETHDLRYV